MIKKMETGQIWRVKAREKDFWCLLDIECSKLVGVTARTHIIIGKEEMYKNDRYFRLLVGDRVFWTYEQCFLYYCVKVI